MGAAYASELASTLGMPPGLLVLRESNLDDAGALLLIDIMPEPAGDMASLTPAAHLLRLKSLVKAASRAAPRALWATTELLRLKPPHGTAEPLLPTSELTMARRIASIPAAIAVIIVSGGVLVSAVACYSLIVSLQRVAYRGVGNDDA